jgi:hypothetical protein
MRVIVEFRLLHGVRIKNHPFNMVFGPTPTQLPRADRDNPGKFLLF